MTQIYKPESGKLMRVAFMFSGGATGLKTTMDDNPHLGKLYDVCCSLSDNPGCDGVELSLGYDIPTAVFDYRNYLNAYPNPLEARNAYFSDVDDFMEEVGPDMIVTTGFMRIAGDPLVRNKHGRIANGHPAKTYMIGSENSTIGDLNVKDLSPSSFSKLFASNRLKGHFLNNDVFRVYNPEFVRLDVGDLPTGEAVRFMERNNLKRKYVGDNAVHDAVLSGEDEVATAVFFLDHGMDTGANIVHSQSLPVDREYVDRNLHERDMEAVRGYTKELQNLLKYYGDGPAIRKALELASTGRLGLSDEVVNPEGLPYLVTDDGKPLPYKGHQI